MSKDEKFVIFASSLGTIFEWYDFYLYAVLAPFFASLFFPAGNDTAALLSAFATYAAGFLVRPFGAIIFGRIGDLGRPQIHLPRHHHGDGHRDIPRRRASDICKRRVAGADHARHPAPLSGSGAGRRIRRRGNVCG
jgi:MFS family permease